METTVTASSYTLRTESGNWLGQIVLTSDGMFSSITDYGNLSFAWRAFRDDFKKFIIGLNTDYFGGKMQEGLAYIAYNTSTNKACQRFAKVILPPLQKALREELGIEEEKPKTDMVTLYKNVFDRKDPVQISFQEFLNFDKCPDIFQKIKSLDDKVERNKYKRDNLPAGDFSNCDFFCVDIDNINLRQRQEIVNKLSKLDFIWVIKESVSGNLCVFIKYDTKLREDGKFPYVYYKKYLELTLALGVNIDFLPELGRLRYVSDGQIFFERETPTIVNDYLEVGELPYINTNTKGEGGNHVFGSGRGIED